MSSLAIFNGVYPAIAQSSSSIRQATASASDRIESRISIIQIAHNTTAANVWIKNIGTAEIGDIEKLDIFFGPKDNFYRVNYAGNATPRWEYGLEGGYTDWRQARTLRITVHPQSSLSTGTYMLKVVLPNGIYDETTFGVE